MFRIVLRDRSKINYNEKLNVWRCFGENVEGCTLFIRIPKFFVELQKPYMFLSFEPMIVLKLLSSAKGLQIKGINILNIVAIV